MFTHFLSLILLVLLFLRTSDGKQTPSCDPSACGNIQNISYPFRLRNDPRHCGESSYELVCENYTTFLHLYESQHKYRVESINCQNYTIRLSDPSVITNDVCSFPQYSQNEFDFRGEQSFDTWSLERLTLLARPVNFLSCPHPVNQSFYVSADLCVEKDNTGRRHKYF